MFRQATGPGASRGQDFNKGVDAEDARRELESDIFKVRKMLNGADVSKAHAERAARALQDSKVSALMLL